ncbi:hypothetical protein ACEPAI_9411 [Sanghuangporus weigelae]
MPQHRTIIPSATQRALFHTPEIQVHIFGTLEDEAAVRCALVCKAWTEKALDRAWSKTFGLRRIFNVLAPLTPREMSIDNGFDFMKPVGARNRTRFVYYSKRIRTLGLFGFDEDELPSESAFIELLKSRLGSNLLPNLETLIVLQCNAKLAKTLLPFLHDSLVCLHLSWKDESMREFDSLLEEVELRSPRLRKLDINAPVDQTAVVERVTQFISRQVLLEEFTITSKLCPIVASLSGLPRLKKVSKLYLGPTDAESEPCGHSHSIGCFPSLLDLGLLADIPKASSFILVHPSFANLRKLTVTATSVDTAGVISEFFTSISESCRILEELALECHVNGTVPDNIITCRILDPITSLRRLRKLSFSVGRPYFDISDDDLEDLLARCSRLESFSLRPLKPSRPSCHMHVPTLRILHRIAECQPDLGNLDIYFDACDVITGRGFIDATITPFRKLNRLHVHNSPPPEGVDKTALYLSHVLSPQCEISQAWPTHSQRSRKAWDSIIARIPLFSDLVSQYRRDTLEFKQRKVDAPLSAAESTDSHRFDIVKEEQD